MPLNRRVRAHLKVRPAELPFHLLVALFHPQPQTIQPYDFREVGRGERRRRRAGGALAVRAARPGTRPTSKS